MKKNKKRHHSRASLQVITLCISTAMVLVLLGIVILSVLGAHNLSSYFKENLTVTLMLNENTTPAESQALCTNLKNRSYVVNATYISPEQACKSASEEMGSDPTEFVGYNPFLGSIEMQLQADYANSDSLKIITSELKSDQKITDITYEKDLMDQVNANLRQISIVLLIIAALLTFISFSLINNTVKLSVYARRFTINTMKLVGASWSFIRWPFIKRALGEGVVAALLADSVLAIGIYGLYNYEPGVFTVLTWPVLAITGVAVLLFGLLLTTICSYFSVNRFLKMKAGELYKI